MPYLRLSEKGGLEKHSYLKYALEIKFQIIRKNVPNRTKNVTKETKHVRE